MHSLGYFLGVPKQTEVLVLTLVGICCTIFDASLLDLNANLRKVWQIALNPDKFSGNSQIYIKYMLSGIVLVRTFSVHLYLAFYIVMLWPAIFEERPALLLPWLIVGAIKSMMMGVMSLSIGVYTCVAYGVYKSACADFVIAQVIDHIPSLYMWFCVVSYYRELKTTTTTTLPCEIIDFESEITMRRRKVRSMADDIGMKHCNMIDEDRHLISVSTIENVVQQLTTDMHRKATRSLDSLLGVIVAEAEKEELMNLCEEPPAEETGLTAPERTAKLLKITPSDVAEAKRRISLRPNSIFTRSMLDIKNIGDRHLNAFKARDRFASMRVDKLRSTRSEKSDLRITDYSWHNTTDFMTNVSEVQIAPVLNYSSASLSVHKMDKYQKKKVTDQSGFDSLKTETFIFPKLKDKVKAFATKFDIDPDKPNDNTRKKMYDFGCQASTLSRNVLKYPREYLAFHRNKNILEKPNQDASEENTTKPVPSKLRSQTEAAKNSSLFKVDGYTLAYKEKMRQKAKARNSRL